ncbi:hypothetical protein [Longimicrobium sp.]|jgi:hypothetical protein|uniref:hypothetical protein n=1 Tax=Longimicrobium sp. TaxID=2029185 RepID=UPI002EDA27E4
MTNREPVGWTPLTAEQRESLPNADHTSLFSRDEVQAALQQLVSASDATRIADELYSDNREPDVFFYGELLTALSRVSESAAARVRTITPGTTE